MKSLSKRELSELFVVNRNCLLEISILLIFQQSDKKSIAIDYTLRQSTLDYLDLAIQKHGVGVIDMAEKLIYVCRNCLWSLYNGRADRTNICRGQSIQA
ncbi:hypothetical protein HNP38_002853 [Chryseobacterium defluvii]|uniref:Uncharacterized protein n=1 Tax=Chryseobacterium defluvii TaxID=160396 RepID=A0A840KHX9_9FLAO|nr:hypothetical protein [Chryseobacterium defluvii]MBB4807547.1 hypothetical protein [Chryseobacterium defluvii]